MVEAIRGYGIGMRAPGRAVGTRGGFRLPENSPAAAEAAGIAPTGPSGLGALNAGVLTPEERDASAARRGTALLTEMAGLQAALLAGHVPESSLRRLSHLTQGEAGADPALRELLEGISLRARVELARLGR
jgi:hypothetical protein